MAPGFLSRPSPLPTPVQRTSGVTRKARIGSARDDYSTPLSGTMTPEAIAIALGSSILTQVKDYLLKQGIQLALPDSRTKRLLGGDPLRRDLEQSITGALTIWR